MKPIFKRSTFLVAFLTTVMFFLLLWFFIDGYLSTETGWITIRISSFVFYGGLALGAVTFFSFFMLGWVATLALDKYERSVKAVSQVINHQSVDKDKLLPEFDNLIRELSELMENNIESLEQVKHRQKTVAIILDQIPDGIVILNETFHMVLINQAAMKIFKIVRPRKKYTFIQLYRHPVLIKYLHRLKDTGPQSLDIEVGRQVIRLQLNKTENGYTIFTKDVTEILRVEQLQRDFSANVSHALKTPVTSIIGFTELIIKGMVTEPAEMVKMSDKIHTQAHHLLTLIEDTMQLAYLESESAYSHDVVEVSEVVQNSLDLLAPQITDKQLAITCVGTGTVNIKYAHLVELVTNLIENAIKYNHPKGSIHIEIKANTPEEERITMSIADTGIGIDEAEFSRVLDRYYRLPSTVHGNGLGLSIVDTIVKLYGGMMTIDSKVGVGTTFTVIL